MQQTSFKDMAEGSSNLLFPHAAHFPLQLPLTVKQGILNCLAVSVVWSISGSVLKFWYRIYL
jgi:hypothetical protein